MRQQTHSMPPSAFLFSTQLCIVLVVALVMTFSLAKPARAQTPIGGSNVIDTLSPAQWYEIPNSKMDSVIPAEYYKSPIRGVSGPRSIMSAWGGGTLDTKRNRLIVWGGGHADYAGNELYAFDINDLKWYRLSDASNPPAIETEAASDGNPVSRHTYGGLAYLANVDSFFGHGGSKYVSGGGTNTAWLFNFKANKWEQKARGADGGHSNTAEYDPNTGTVIVLSGVTLSRFDPVKNIWSKISGNNAGLGYQQHGAFDSTRNQFILLGGARQSYMYDVAERDSKLSKINFTGAVKFLKDPYPGIVYVAATDKYYGWSGGQNIYEITPDTWHIRALPVASGSATPTIRNRNGTYGRFDYVPSKNVFIAVNRSSENVFVFKLDVDETVAPTPLVKPEPRLSVSALDPIFPRAANTSPSAIAVSELTQDGATTETLSLYLPIHSGDTDDDAVAIVEYRKTGDPDWRQALDLFKHDLTPVAPFSGMIFNLKPDTSYDVRVTVEDPDGGSTQQIKTMRTRAIPKVIEATQINTVNVSNSLELHSALDSATPGQVILLAPGIYDDDFRITKRNGTAEDPITIRGADNFSSVIDGLVMINDSNFIHVEGVHVTHSTHGVVIRDWGPGGDGTIGNVIRGNLISNVEMGIVAKSNGRTGPGHNDLYIVDNILEGTNIYGDVSSATWDDEGITVVGRNIEVAYNTLSGFGDSLGLAHTDRTRSVDIHHNYVIYGGDDGVELDFGVRNVAARENLIANTGDGISTQYIQEGPAYTYKNLIYNVLPSRGPFKIKPEAACNSGIFHFNNTSLNAGRAWMNHSGCGKDINLYNNLFTGDRTEKDILRLDSSTWAALTLDYNAYIYDGLMQFSHEFFTTFTKYKSSSKNGNHDVLIMTDPVFRNAPIFAPQELLGTQKDPLDKDFRLAADSNAINAGKILPTITNGFIGSGPDIGAYESNDPAIKLYGVRNNSITSFIGSTLTILVTQVDDTLYRIEMSLIEAATLTFRVTASELATSTDTSNVAIFANNILTIPKVTVEKAIFRVEMTLIDSETNTFSVSGISAYPQSE